MFRLYLLRHANAAWPAPGSRDFDRPLDMRGRAEARDVAEQALVAGYQPEAMVSSPAVRCLQTSEAFLSVFRTLTRIEDEQLYSGSTDAYLEQIKAHKHLSSLLLIGHNPMIEALAHHLCRPDPMLDDLAMGYPTAGLLVLEFSSPLPGKLLRSGSPVALITPSLI